jgi:hypothetical protein
VTAPNEADCLLVAGNTASEQPHSTVGSTLGPKGTTQSSTSRQPFDQTLRQESYTNDTDRSFPLAGGVAPKHDTSARHPTEHTSTTQHPTEHHTSSTIPAAQQTSTTHYPVTSEREPGTKEREVGVHEGHGRDGLAGAAAAATGLGVAPPLAQSHQRDVHDQGLETRDASYGAQPTTTSGTVRNLLLQISQFNCVLMYSRSFLLAPQPPLQLQPATQHRATIPRP